MTSTKNPTATTFAYVVEGETVSGTLEDYARDYASAHYNGCDISQGGFWIDADGEARPLEIVRESTGYNSDDYATVSFAAEFPTGVEEALSLIHI